MGIDVGTLRGRRALVTGGGSGIGAAVARALARAGADVVVADVVPATAQKVADEIGATAVALDVSDPAAWPALTTSLGPVDLAVLAAGVIGPRTVVGADPAELQRVIAVDLLGVVAGTSALAATMPAGGRILAVASAAGLFPMPLAPAYGAAKWGVVGWVVSAAPLLAESDVTLCALCPAWTDTPFLSESDRSLLAGIGASVMPVSDVVDQALALLVSGRAGEVVHVDAEHGAATAVMAPRFTPVGREAT